MRVMIAGSGMIGGAVARHLAATGHTAVMCSRRPPADPAHAGREAADWRRLDVTDADGCAGAVRTVKPDAVVLVHGPSDVTWCEAHPDEALAAHTAGARNLVATAGDARLLLISTDNVFGDGRPVHDEDAPTTPANAYGRAKLRAEQLVQDAGPRAGVLRVSAVYGPQRAAAGGWLNFFASCVARLERGKPVDAPVDQWNTPVLIEDTVRLIGALLSTEAPPLLHLGGPERVSRFEWARLIAAAFGHPADLVEPVPRIGGRYACRPENACLTSTRLPRLGATAGIRIRGVREGVAALRG
jgi:dTDP-4-dehydrorhamnose reductase